MYDSLPGQEINSGEPMSYSDEYIDLNSNCLTINKYMFPLSMKKVIKIEDIKAVELIEMGRLTGKYTFIGYTWSMVWLHMDRKRPNKTHCITIDDGSFTKNGITPDDPQKVFLMLKELRKLVQGDEGKKIKRKMD